MKRFPPVFDSKEAAILLAMYEEADGAYSTLALTRKLYPTVKMGTPSALTAFVETRDATERLISRGLVRGERSKGAAGVQFDKLRLTAKGEQAAIQQRETDKRTKKALTEVMELSDSVVAEMEKRKKDREK
jgi:hypothetical protein